MSKLLESNLFVVTVLIVLAIISVLILNFACQTTMERVEWEEEVYRVQSGDTLWALSRDYCPENVDRREWIEEIQSLNGLTSSFIYPGQNLTVLAQKK